MQMLYDVATVIHEDHERVNELFGQLKQGRGRQQEIVDTIITLLSQHATAEEQVVYPRLEEAQTTNKLRDIALDEHQTMKNILARLEEVGAASSEAARLMGQLQFEVTRHVFEEEAQILPMLRSVIGEQEMQDLVEEFVAARDGAPTRARDSVSGRTR